MGGRRRSRRRVFKWGGSSTGIESTFAVPDGDIWGVGKCRSVGGMVEVLFTETTVDTGADTVGRIHEEARSVIFVVRDSVCEVCLFVGEGER